MPDDSRLREGLTHLSPVFSQRGSIGKQINSINMFLIRKSGEIYRWRLNKLARLKNFNIHCITYNETDTTHAIAASCRAPFAAKGLGCGLGCGGGGERERINQKSNANTPSAKSFNLMKHKNNQIWRRFLGSGSSRGVGVLGDDMSRTDRTRSAFSLTD